MRTALVGRRRRGRWIAVMVAAFVSMSVIDAAFGDTVSHPLALTAVGILSIIAVIEWLKQ